MQCLGLSVRSESGCFDAQEKKNIPNRDALISEYVYCGYVEAVQYMVNQEKL